MFDFRIATVFCLGNRLSRHKMTGYLKNLEGIMGSWATPLSTPLLTYEEAQIVLKCMTDVQNYRIILFYKIFVLQKSLMMCFCQSDIKHFYVKNL